MRNRNTLPYTYIPTHSCIRVCIHLKVTHTQVMCNIRESDEYFRLSAIRGRKTRVVWAGWDRKSSVGRVGRQDFLQKVEIKQELEIAGSQW